MTTATRHVGFCPICEGDFKLADGNKLVHHGYRRPGVGYIIGDCLSVHAAPYELSDEVCHTYKNMLLGKLAFSNKYLARLNRGEVTCFEVERRKTGSTPWNPEYEYVDVATPNGYDFTRELDEKVRQTEYEIKNLKSEIARMDGWISKWELKPIRTFEEELEKKAAATAARKAERDAKRAVKQAKADALKAKYARWEQEKLDLMKKYKDLLLALDAEMVEAEGRDPKVAGKIVARAQETFHAMCKAKSKKSYLNFSPRDLDMDAVLIGLCCAKSEERSHGTWVNYIAW